MGIPRPRTKECDCIRDGEFYYFERCRPGQERSHPVPGKDEMEYCSTQDQPKGLGSELLSPWLWSLAMSLFPEIQTS